MQVNPYLFFNGTCAEALALYAQCLGGKIVAMMTYGDAPMKDQMPVETHGQIMHARLEVGDGWVLMASDAFPDRYQTPAGFSLSIGVEDAAEAERVFAALAEGGTVHMPLAETFWAVRFGMLVDRFGTPWMVNCERPA